MVYQAEDRARTKKQQADTAIQLALQGRWAEAVLLNRAIVEAFPGDVDSYNRLGKALTELGRYSEARDAYMKGLEIDPLNTIARKNLIRLSALGDAAPPREANQKLSPQMFIEEMGKTGTTTLLRANMETAARMTAGDQVSLGHNGGVLLVQTLGGEYLGEVEPKLGQRLLKLIGGGNEYVAAISGMDETQVRVFIRETFQHASQTGKLSFPPTVQETFRPYVKGRLLRRDMDDEGFYEEMEEGEEWEGAAEAAEPEADMEGFGAETDTRGHLDLGDEEE